MVELLQTIKWRSVQVFMFPQTDVLHQNTFVTQPFIAYTMPLENHLPFVLKSIKIQNTKAIYHTTKMTSEEPTSFLPYKLNHQNQAKYQHNVARENIRCGQFMWQIKHSSPRTQR